MTNYKTLGKRNQLWSRWSQLTTASSAQKESTVQAAWSQEIAQPVISVTLERLWLKIQARFALRAITVREEPHCQSAVTRAITTLAQVPEAIEIVDLVRRAITV